MSSALTGGVQDVGVRRDFDSNHLVEAARCRHQAAAKEADPFQPHLRRIVVQKLVVQKLVEQKLELADQERPSRGARLEGQLAQRGPGGPRRAQWGPGGARRARDARRIRPRARGAPSRRPCPRQ
eukprot:299891-Prorocentrum_minimum.AAC.2